MMLEPLLAGPGSLWVLGLVRASECLGGRRRCDLLLSRRLVESLDDAFGIFGPRIEGCCLARKQSFLRLVLQLVHLDVCLVLVSLGCLLVSEPLLHVLGTADRRRQVYLRLLRHRGVRPLPGGRSVLALPS